MVLHIFHPQSHSCQNLFLIGSLTSFSFCESTCSQNVEEDTMDVKSKSMGAFTCFTYFSTYPLRLYLSDWTERLRVSVTTTELAWVHVNVFERVLNAIECTCVCMNAFEWVLNVIEHDWMHVSAFEGVWMQLNAFYYWFLHAIECMWMPLSECVCDWTCLSVCEHLWASIECNWMRLIEHTCVSVKAFEQLWYWRLSARKHLWVSMEPKWMHTYPWGNRRENL